MATEIKLPELGENLTGGDVLDVRVAPGDVVREGQTLLEVEAEKATVEVPAPMAGRVSQMLVKKGDSIRVGQTLCLIDHVEGAITDHPKEARVRQTAGAKTESEPVRSGQQTGKTVEQERIQPESEERLISTKTVQRPTANGIDKAAGDGQRREENESLLPMPATTKLVPAGPATRRLARELGIDLGLVSGTAPGGRVTQEDLKAYVRGLASSGAAGGISVPPLPDFERWGRVERRPLDGLRRKTAEQMSLAWQLIPHVTQDDQADITELDSFRREQSSHGPKLTVTAFALKAAVIALRQFPQFNASLDLPGNQLIVKQYYHIGVAVDTERGLLVPVLRDVDKKSVQELAQELATLAERARQKKIQADEMRGGTFTITNLGGIGGSGFTPIVNYPEVAILGLSRARLQPVVLDDQIAPRLILPLSLSYDHRVIDGADAARFARRIAELLEDPLLMLLNA